MGFDPCTNDLCSSRLIQFFVERFHAAPTEGKLFDGNEFDWCFSGWYAERISEIPSSSVLIRGKFKVEFSNDLFYFYNDGIMYNLSCFYLHRYIPIRVILFKSIQFTQKIK